MDQTEQETQKDDPAVEITNLPSAEGESNVGPRFIEGPPLASARPVNADPTSARSPSIWRNWPLVTAGGILLLLVIMVLPILPTIRNQLSQRTSPYSAPGTNRVTLTPTPIIPSSWGAGTVSPAVVNGVAYIGAEGGAVSAVRLSDGSLLWQHKTKGDTSGVPLVVNGVVYAAANFNNGPAYVYALSASNGSLLWSYKTGSYAFIPMVVNGVAYIASEDHTVTALQASDGRLLWQSRLKDRVFDPPIVDSGVVFVTSDKNMLYALRASDGTQLWRYASDTGFPLALNGVVYAGLGQTLVALRAATGTVLWRTSLDGFPWFQPLINSGIIYLVVTKITEETSFVPTHGGGYELREAIPNPRKAPAKTASASICALQMSDGSILWCYKSANTKGWPMQIALSRGEIFGATSINTSRGYVYALRADNGSLLWSNSGQDGPVTLTVGNGAVYMSANNVLFALRMNDGSPLWRYAIFGTVPNAPVLDGTTIYAGADNGITYALQANTGILRWYYLTKISN